MEKKWDLWLNSIRQQEFDVVKGQLLNRVNQTSGKIRLLEIGGGNGYLAKCLSDLGFDVVSIDIEPREPCYFPVRKGDCTRLNFEGKSFDIIFSSQVLPFVDNLDAALSEMKRVLKSDGLMVHTLPTHYSTIFTLVLQPISYFIQIWLIACHGLKLGASAFRRSENLSENNVSKFENKPPSSTRLNKENIYKALKTINPVRIFLTWPLPPNNTCFSELANWRTNIWCKRFERHGWKVKDIIPSPIAYSRHGIFPFKLMKLRRWLGKRGMSAGAAYLVQH